MAGIVEIDRGDFVFLCSILVPNAEIWYIRDVLKRGAMVGRKKELNALQKALASDESAFVAIYGRRRIGKTYLVREFFKGGFVFQHTGLEKGDVRKQLSAFRDSLEDCGMSGCAVPACWMEAFRTLRDLVARSKGRTKGRFKVWRPIDFPLLEAPLHPQSILL